jgi:hypothetical protein
MALTPGSSPASSDDIDDLIRADLACALQVATGRFPGLPVESASGELMASRLGPTVRDSFRRLLDVLDSDDEEDESLDEQVSSSLGAVILAVRTAIDDVDHAVPILWTKDMWSLEIPDAGVNTADAMDPFEAGDSFQAVEEGDPSPNVSTEVVYSTFLLKKAVTRALRQYRSKLPEEVRNDIAAFELNFLGKYGHIHAIFDVKIHFKNGETQPLELAIPVSRKPSTIDDTVADYEGLRHLKDSGVAVRPQALITVDLPDEMGSTVTVECMFTQLLKNSREISVQGNGDYDQFEPSRPDEDSLPIDSFELGSDMAHVMFTMMFRASRPYVPNVRRGDLVYVDNEGVRAISTAWREALERDNNFRRFKVRVLERMEQNNREDLGDAVAYMFMALDRVEIKDLHKGVAVAPQGGLAFSYSPEMLVKGLLMTADVYDETAHESSPKGLNAQQFVNAFWTLYYTLRLFTLPQMRKPDYYREIYAQLHEIALRLGLQDESLHPDSSEGVSAEARLMDLPRQCSIIKRGLSSILLADEGEE